jgi:XTP/dITP diphosphohydrolase
MSGYIGVGDDSGLEVNALGGAPGIYSARYAGEHGNDEANNQLLLQNLADKQDRSGAFVCAIACVFPEELNNAHVFLGKTEGEILHAYRGNTGFGYDPLFYYPPMEKSYAEMTADEKNSISHRGRAMQLLVDFLVKNYNGV